MNLYLIAMYGLKAIKPKQTLVQQTSNCKELNSYLYIRGWFLYIWGWQARVLVYCGQYPLYTCRYPVYTNAVNFYTCEGDLYSCRWFLYIWGKFYTFEGIYTFEGPTNLDGFITITDKKVVKFFVNTGTGKITTKSQIGQNQISGQKLN